MLMLVYYLGYYFINIIQIMNYFLLALTFINELKLLVF